jgi:transmembrane sensor
MRRPERPTSSDASQEASVWLARLERGLRAEEGPAIREWLKHGPNRQAIAESARLLHGPDINAALATLIPVEPRRNVVKAGGKSGLTMPLVFALVSTSTLVATFMGGGRTPADANADLTRRMGNTDTYATSVGQTRKVKLADGSTMTLNTGTRVSVTYSERARDVYLVEGEVSFDVAFEPRRPFIVTAGRRQFEAVDTSFNLRELTQDNVELTVTRGSVKVLDAPPRLPDTPARRRAPITFGEATVHELEAALVEPGFQLVNSIEAGDVEARTAWQHGLIICENRTLEELLAEVERYTPAKFVLADEALRDVRISGQFRIGNVNAVRQALRQQFSVGSHRDGNQIVLTALRTS